MKAAAPSVVTLPDLIVHLCNGVHPLPEVHQSTALRACRKTLAHFGGKVHSEKLGGRRRGLSWTAGEDLGDQVRVIAPTWGCAAAGLAAAVAMHVAMATPRPREGVEL